MKGGESFGERILREMLENITGNETYMNEMAKRLREAAGYTKGDGVTSAEAIAKVRDTLGVNPNNISFAGYLGAVLEIIADELDALQAQTAEAHNLRAKLASAEIKATRRKNHAESLSATVTERNARLKERGRRIGELKNEVNELRKQVPSEKERQILDMWPRFEDTGEPVMVGDAFVDDQGGERRVAHVAISEASVCIADSMLLRADRTSGEVFKRPESKVVDADGVEIHMGDTVYELETGEEYKVERVFSGTTDPDFPDHTIRCNKVADPITHAFRPDQLTHTRRDSWERLEEDTMKGSCAYFGFADKPCSDGDGCPANKPGDCAKFKAVDIVRRAKALAGVEVD